MIIAAGLSPAWQQILEVTSLETGEVNRCQSAQWTSSGKVINVGIAVRHLGTPCETIYPAGGFARELISNELEQLGVSSCVIPQQTPTRVCTTILDRSTGKTTELVENAQPITTEELAAFKTEYLKHLKSAQVVVLTGSLPAGTPSSFYRDLIAETHCPVILDARGPELEAALEEKPFLVKPNHEELERTLMTELADTEALIKGMQEINERGATWVVISQGKDTLWATSREHVYCFTPARAEVVNPIACGDSLAAGIAVALHRGKPVPDAIRRGMAAAADNLTQLLPARLSETRMQTFYDQIEVEQIA
ncbi:1-phosphofructokinase family hexose kinase [Gimesia chilikensis]|uniref:1-phosphofructokinase family hexose kinase n=1 Tax=Gimesia chilikensis TaxID=2605989 RepID=UPI0011ED3D06|nr:1-phosphofructokinase family hexose kinase [Gimesia chilikensis]KAA0132150.1 1-phosphofructokinase family hexose kinase [Gimesia chilikensis]